MRIGSYNISIVRNSDGFELSGGATARKLKVQSGDVTLTGGGSYVHTMPQFDATLASLAQIQPHLSTNRIMPKYHYSMDSGWSDWYGVGTTSHDSTDKIDGDASNKIVTAAGGTLQFCGRRFNITDVSMSGHSFRVFVKSSNWSTVNEAKLLISTGSTFANRYDFDIKPLLLSPANNEWIEVTFCPQNLTVGAGTPSLATADDLIVRAADTGTATTVWFDGLSVIPINRTKGIVSIVFDSGFDSQYTIGKAYLDKYGYKGTYYVNYDLVGDAGYMTQSQQETLLLSGSEVGMTSTSDLTALPAANLTAELDAVRSYQTRYGFSDNYAYPDGVVNDAVRKEVAKRFSSARGLFNAQQNIDHITPFGLNAFRPTNATSTATLTGIIDKAVADKSWAIIVFRKIVTSASASNEYSTANYQTVIDYLNTSGVSVMPVDQVLKLAPAY